MSCLRDLAIFCLLANVQFMFQYFHTEIFSPYARDAYMKIYDLCVLYVADTEYKGASRYSAFAFDPVISAVYCKGVSSCCERGSSL